MLPGAQSKQSFPSKFGDTGGLRIARYPVPWDLESGGAGLALQNSKGLPWLRFCQSGSRVRDGLARTIGSPTVGSREPPCTATQLQMCRRAKQGQTKHRFLNQRPSSSRCRGRFRTLGLCARFPVKRVAASRAKYTPRTARGQPCVLTALPPNPLAFPICYHTEEVSRGYPFGRTRGLGIAGTDRA